LYFAGNDNVAVGVEALNNMTASGGTAVGYRALKANTSGGSNSAFGNGALQYNVEAMKTPRPVLFPYIRIRMAITTPRRDLRRFMPVPPPVTTPPRVGERSISLRPGRTTLLPVSVLS
jgi:hypothetical protein